MTEEHKRKISEACKHPKKKIFYRFYYDGNQFQIDLVASIEQPEDYKPLTVKAIENSKGILSYK